MESEQKYTPEEKLRWEIVKLQAETKNLSRPWISNPASWFTIITTAVASTTVFFQITKSDIDYKMSMLDNKKAKIEGDSIKIEIEKQKKVLELVRNQVESGQKEQVVLGKSSETNPISQTQNAEDIFKTINAAIQNPDTLAQFVAVIATLRTPTRAVERAKGIMTRNSTKYDINVYKKADGQYTLTLGGRLTYLEASRRIEYAKQSGFPDAVVRLARNWGDNLNK